MEGLGDKEGGCTHQQANKQQFGFYLFRGHGRDFRLSGFRDKETWCRDQHVDKQPFTVYPLGGMGETWG